MLAAEDDNIIVEPTRKTCLHLRALRVSDTLLANPEKITLGKNCLHLRSMRVSDTFLARSGRSEFELPPKQAVRTLPQGPRAGSRCTKRDDSDNEAHGTAARYAFPETVRSSELQRFRERIEIRRDRNSPPNAPKLLDEPRKTKQQSTSKKSSSQSGPLLK